MDYDAKINELEKIFGSYTIEDYYCNPKIEFIISEIEKVFNFTVKEVKNYIIIQLPIIVRKNRMPLSKYHSHGVGSGDSFDCYCEDYRKLQKFADIYNLEFKFIEAKEDVVLNEGRSYEKIVKKNSGEITNLYFTEKKIYNYEGFEKSFFSNRLRDIPKNWKDIISQFLDADVEKIGKYFYLETESKIYQTFASKYEGQQFAFGNEDFNRFEMATIIAIKKALRSGNFFKNKNKILLDLRNGLSCEIEFKEKGEIISQKVNGRNVVISSDIVNLSDDNGRRVIGRLNKFYYFFTKDYLIKIEFVETGILR